MYILGISAFYHDSAAALLFNGEIIAAAQEERFTRIKNDHSFPVHSIRFCLQFAGISLNELETVVFYEKPFLKFERIIETYYEAVPFGLRSFVQAIPVWLKGKLFMKRKIKEYLESIEKYDYKKVSIAFSEHHLSHAASAFFPSGFSEAAILTVDGVGEWATCTIAHGEGNRISTLRQLNFPHSLGLLYSAFTYFCGFKVNQDEYKLMGLTAYGNEEDEEYKMIRNVIEEVLVKISPDGSIFLHPDYFAYTRSLRMVDDKTWARLFGIQKRKAGSPLSQSYCNMALAIQHVTEKIMLLLAKEASRLTGSDNLCLAGGVALNCIANGKILQSGIFKSLFIQPASNDAGGAVGAALAVHYIHFDKQKPGENSSRDFMKGSLLGPSYPENEIIREAGKFNLLCKKIVDDSFYSHVSQLLQQGKVIAWFQERMEFGPRALGNRSILADPRNEQMQKQLNEKVKFRESFRPFAPVILEEEASTYFEIETASPYMLLAAKLRAAYRIPYPDNAEKWSLPEKLNYKRSFIPAVTHIDYTARLQTVDGVTNPKLYALLKTFFSDTGCPLLINTSYNTDNEPIVNSPADAFRCFMNTNIDFLVIHNFIYEKIKND